MPKAEPEYTTTKRRRRPSPPPSAVRTMDLYGRPESGSRPVIWDRAARDTPIDRFERDGRWIESGHYVIDHHGTAVVVHCGNCVDGTISLQFMRGELCSRSVPRDEIEPLLLGKVVVDKEGEGRFVEQIREIARLFQRRGDEGEEV